MSLVIDVGHGWRATGPSKTFDPGAVGRLNEKAYAEHNIALMYARSLRDACLALDPTLSVHLLVATEANPLTLAKRRAYMPSASALLSIHLNAHTNRLARGHEVWYHHESHLPFAQAVYRAGVDALGLPRRGIRQQAFTVLRRERPAALVELGFISNVDDLQQLLLTTVRTDWARAVAHAIRQYLSSGGAQN